MEDERRYSIGTPSPVVSTGEAPSSEHTTSRRRGGGQKRKLASINNNGSSSAFQTTSHKRQVREKLPSVPFFPIHMDGPCTRTRVQPNHVISFSAAVFQVKSEAEVREAAAKAEEMIRANENWEALDVKIEVL